MAEGPDIHSVEVGGGLAHTGLNDGLIENSSTSWNASTQKITVNPNTSYILTGWCRTTSERAPVRSACVRLTEYPCSHKPLSGRLRPKFP
jgi:hypothetical protein